jgi:predicted phage baseplate assembly protein
MTDMMLYRINQVPDVYYAKFLDLVGIKPFPATPAQAELTFWLSSVEADPVTVPAETQVGTEQTEAESSIIFMTDEDLYVAQPTLIACQTSEAGTEQYTDRWEDLEYARSAVTCFTSPELVPGDSFLLGFQDSVAGNTLRLDIEASIQGLGVEPANPPLRWEVWSGEEWIRTRVYSDTTGGLNQNGAVTLLVPRQCAPITLGTQRAYWLRARLLRPEEGQPTYAESPAVENLKAYSLGGTVLARHSEPASGESLGVSDGTSDQRFQLSNTPVLSRREGEVIEVVTGEHTEEWTEVLSFQGTGPDDKVYTIDPMSGEVAFGPEVMYPDGSRRQHGAIPPGGAEVRVSRYRFGGGKRGNVGAGTLNVMKTTIPFISRAENLDPARNGNDAETITNAKVRGPMTLRTGERAVTTADFERLALEASTHVSRAKCLPPEEPGEPIRLLLVPKVDRRPENIVLDDFSISDELLHEVREYLEPRRIMGSSIEIMTPYYKGASVVTRVEVAPGWNLDLVRDRCLQALYGYINPLMGGGSDGHGWPFLWDLNAGAVFQLLDSIEGVGGVEDVILFEADLRNQERLGRSKDRIDLEANSLFASFNHYVLVR